MATRKKPVRGQRAKTNAAKKKSAAKAGSTAHRVTQGKGPRVIGAQSKIPKNLQRLRKAQSRNK